jgi:hypothetical protein
VGTSYFQNELFETHTRQLCSDLARKISSTLWFYGFSLFAIDPKFRWFRNDPGYPGTRARVCPNTRRVIDLQINDLTIAKAFTPNFRISKWVGYSYLT